MDRLTRRVAAAAVVAAVCACAGAQQPARKATASASGEERTGAARSGVAALDADTQAALGVSGLRFAVGGRADFLVGVSLFDALGATPPRDADLDALRDLGFRVVRVWAHWNQPIYGADGSLSDTGRQRLADLTKRLAARGLILELVALRPGQLPGQRFAVLASTDARIRAAREIALALKGQANVFVDLYNEHDHPDGPISHAELRKLRDAVKGADPDRLVTVSSTEHHFLRGDGTLHEAGLRSVREEAVDIGVDVLAAHLPRTQDWAERTAARVGAIVAALQKLDRTIPVYLNEEQRARSDRTVPRDAYARALKGAREGGAAGWVFHTAAGYDLGQRPFLEALGAEEKAALALLARPAQ